MTMLTVALSMPVAYKYHEKPTLIATLSNKIPYLYLRNNKTNANGCLMRSH